ncbi:MAG: glycosyltransferase family 9 protein [Candidatus Sericytochromatia bacterium]|nr:glycosyltransferase family 9 protein [Candidatus Tanganyikabacteria bacterium]
MTGRRDARAPWQASEIRRILFVQFGGIGDVILAFPAIKSLREAYPDARLTLMVESRAKGVGAFNPAIDEVLAFDAKDRPTLAEFLDVVGGLRSRYFDLAVASGRSPAIPALLLLSGARYRVGYAANPLSMLLTVAAPLERKQYAGWMYYDLVGSFLDIPACVPQVVVAPDDQAWATEFRARNGLVDGDAVVVLHPGASRMAARRGIHKTWEPRRWAEVARQLLAASCKVVLAGGPDDDEGVAAILATGLEGVVVAHGQTRSLGQLAALIQRAALLIAVDSAPMHLGIAVGTPTVGIFGPTDPDKLIPPGTSHQAVHVGGLACRPCLWDRRSTTCQEITCLRDLTPDMVLAAAHRALPSRADTRSVQREAE